jgi:nicotinate phosphoribosyltransferase
MVRDEDLALLVDLYELAMTQAYWAEGMNGTAVFSLFFRKLPPHRNFILACGQQHVARVIASLRFLPEHLNRLEPLQMFQPDFLDWLGHYQFSGSLHALAEGTPVFPQEPLLEIEAPILEAQLLESLVMNYVHLESVLASKAVRVTLAAGSRPVIDFGMRRMHGVDAAWRGARAYRLAGIAGTSNVLAGLDFGLPVRGTMAHSFVQACSSELEAFKAYAHLYPETTLLVDTYDTRHAVRSIIDWLRHEPDTRVGAIRLDSGDLAAEARMCRQMLDEAGFSAIRIVASSSLDEYKIRAMVEAGAPIDSFGVGTAIGAASDSPSLDLAYKLTEYAGQPRMKNSPGKQSYPGRKQIYRRTGPDGSDIGDSINARDEPGEGQPLLVATMRDGKTLEKAIKPLDDAVAASREAVQRLPAVLHELDPPAQDYPVQISDRLKQLQADTLAKLTGDHP